METYIPRIIDSIIERSVRYSGGILIEGVKGCGKTRSASMHSKSSIYLHDPYEYPNYKKMAETMPALILEGEAPRLIDEWQLFPELWNGIKYLIDVREDPGQFILTGSATPPADDNRHSGAGRITRVLMRPLSLFESGDSNGTISLEGLFASSDIKGASSLSVKGMVSALIRGGWPATINKDKAYSAEYIKNYINNVANIDISSVDNVKRNPLLVWQLLRSISRNVSTVVSNTTIQRDIQNCESISDKTLSGYINALNRIYILEDLYAWNPSLRSSAIVRTSPKRHFVDPSIATSILNVSEEALLKDMNTLGFLFESLCIRDLRIYAESIDGEVYHYRDSSDFEIDAIVQMRDGRWGAIEIKLGMNEIDKASRNLLRLRDSIDEERMMKPSFLMILTAGQHAFTLEDGIMVVPIGCLRN